jgi:hypothetical protein
MGNSLGLLVFTKQSARLVDGVISDTDGESKPSRNVGLLVPAKYEVIGWHVTDSTMQ